MRGLPPPLGPLEDGRLGPLGGWPLARAKRAGAIVAGYTKNVYLAPSAHHILGPLEIRPAAGPTTRYNMGTGQIRPTPFANNPAMTTIEQAGAELLRAMDLLAEQQAVVAEAKARVMELMTDAGVKTVKLQTAQIQVVETPVWEYRDRGVTTAREDVERAEKVVKAEGLAEGGGIGG